MTEAEPEIGQLRRYPYRYEDNQAKHKERPIVVALVCKDEGFAMLVKVTSHEPRKEFPGELRLADWKQEGLDGESTVRCSKTVNAAIADVAAAPLIGYLSKRDLDTVTAQLRMMGKL